MGKTKRRNVEKQTFCKAINLRKLQFWKDYLQKKNKIENAEITWSENSWTRRATSTACLQRYSSDKKNKPLFFLFHLSSCRSWLNNEVWLPSAAPTASCSLIFSWFSRGAARHHGSTPLFGAEKHLGRQEMLEMSETQSSTSGAQYAMTMRHLRHFCEDDDFICKSHSLVPQRVNTVALTCLAFVLFCFYFFFLKGKLRIIMGNFKNQAQMRLSRTDVLLCSLILTWHGAPAENLLMLSWRKPSSKFSGRDAVAQRQRKVGKRVGKMMKLSQTQIIHEHTVLFPRVEDHQKSTDLSICWRFGRFESITPKTSPEGKHKLAEGRAYTALSVRTVQDNIVF